MVLATPQRLANHDYRSQAWSNTVMIAGTVH